MLKLTELPKNYIEKYGRDKVAEVIGQKPAVLSMWLSRDSWPIDAIEKLLAFDPAPIHAIQPFYDNTPIGDKLAICVPCNAPIYGRSMESIVRLYNPAEMQLIRRSFNNPVIVRNTIAQMFLDSGCEWSFWHDADMVMPTGDAQWFKEASGIHQIPDVFCGVNSILRLLHHSYFGMRSVRCVKPTEEVPVTGYHVRGNFYGLTIPAGKKFYVNARHLAGFSHSTKKISTHIKIHPVFWCLREHFFTVVEGPSTVLLYSPSAFVERTDMVFETRRLVSFDISRSFTASTVQSQTVYSFLRNLLDKTVYLKFLEEGLTLAEAHHEGGATGFSLRKLLLHVLAFLKF